MLNFPFSAKAEIVFVVIDIKCVSYEIQPVDAKRVMLSLDWFLMSESNWFLAVELADFLRI